MAIEAVANALFIKFQVEDTLMIIFPWYHNMWQFTAFIQDDPSHLFDIGQKL